MTDTELDYWTFGAVIMEQDKKSSCTSDLFRSHQNVSVARVWQTGTEVSVLILPGALVYKAPTDISGSCKYPAPLKDSSLIPCSRSCGMPTEKPRIKYRSHLSPL